MFSNPTLPTTKLNPVLLSNLMVGRHFTLTTMGLSLVSNECCRGLLPAEREPAEPAEPPRQPPPPVVEAAVETPEPVVFVAASTLSMDPVNKRKKVLQWCSGHTRRLPFLIQNTHGPEGKKLPKCGA